MEYRFKQIKLSNAEKLWLTEILGVNFSNVDAKHLKVELWKKIPEGFDPKAIDSRLIRDNRLTLIGLWHIDPQNPIFSHVLKTIETIKGLIQKHPDTNRIKAEDIAQLVGITEREMEIALMLIYDLGGFFGSASASNTRKGFQEVSFTEDDSAYDEFLKFKNLEQKMEQFFISHTLSSNIKKGKSAEKKWQKCVIILAAIATILLFLFGDGICMRINKKLRSKPAIGQNEKPNAISFSGNFNNCTFNDCSIKESQRLIDNKEVNSSNEPLLKLFVPYYFTAIDGVTLQPVLLMFVRISNDTKSTAVLYPETMSIEVRNKNTWYRTQILKTDNTTPLQTDFDESKKVAMGLNDAKYLNIHSEGKVTYDNPISGWVPVAFENRTILEDIDAVKISIEDSHLRKHQMQIDLMEQRRKHDSSYEK